MKRILFLLPIVALIACNSPQSESAGEEVDVVVETPTLHVYGDTIQAEGAMQPSEFLAAMEGKSTMDAKLMAPINQTCKMKGCWMTLDMGDGNEMRVKFKDYGFFVPTEGAEGKTAIIEGFAYTDTTSVEDLKHLAEDAGKSEEEIAAIKEPEIGLNFEAYGVIIKDEE